jgi:hypothetical protein
MKDKKQSELSWKQSDFIKAGEEVPEKLLHDTLHTEGELMTEAELAEWLTDTQATFSIIKQKDPARFDELYGTYILDIQYLSKIGKITDEEEAELTKIERFDF